MRIPIRESDNLLLLSMLFCSKAGYSLPVETSKEQELINIIVDCVNKLESEGYGILFDDIENAIDENGIFKDYFTNILEGIAQNIENRHPILFTSQFFPNIPSSILEYSRIRKIDRLDDYHLQLCLESWLSQSDHTKVPTKATLQTISKQLFGYPFAARLGD